MSDKQKQAFAAEYKALCERHEIAISSCGVCGAQYLLEADPGSIAEKCEQLLKECDPCDLE